LVALLSKEYEKVIKKQKVTGEQAKEGIDKLISLITDVKASINANQQSTTTALQELASKVKLHTASMVEAHKDLHGLISKYGKSLDKKFKVDLDAIWDPNAFTGKEIALNRALQSHFMREGRFDLTNTFSKESGLDIPEELKAQFSEMYQILESMKKRDLQPAINWAKLKRRDLDRIESSLEFNLHKLQFIQYLTGPEPSQALAYAKTNFPLFSSQHMKG